MKRLQVWDLDVWGHGAHECADYDCPGECEGYTVNNRSRSGTIELSDDASESEVRSALYDQGFTTSPDGVSVEWIDEDCFDANDVETGMPIFQIVGEP